MQDGVLALGEWLAASKQWELNFGNFERAVGGVSWAVAGCMRMLGACTPY
jgi:hypothetical protein